MTPMTKSGFKPIQALIRESDGIAPIHDRLIQRSRLQQTVADALPPGMNTSCRVATLEGSTLIIAVANGAVAAKLKQMLPRLLDKFRENKKQEQEVTAIGVIVQPDFFRLEKPEVIGAPRAPMTAEQMSGLSASLADSPLKETVERIRKKRERALTLKSGNPRTGG